MSRTPNAALVARLQKAAAAPKTTAVHRELLTRAADALAQAARDLAIQSRNAAQARDRVVELKATVRGTR